MSTHGVHTTRHWTDMLSRVHDGAFTPVVPLRTGQAHPAHAKGIHLAIESFIHLFGFFHIPIQPDPFDDDRFALEFDFCGHCATVLVNYPSLQERILTSS